MTQRETTRETAPQDPATITIEDATHHGTRRVPPSTPCVNAGPKYRALDSGGAIESTRVDRRDLMTIDATVIGSLVYVPDSSDGKIPQLYRLCRVTGGRPNRLPGAP